MGKEGMAMSDRTKAARVMRESAEQLRRIALLQNFLEPTLSRMARELEATADQLEEADQPHAPTTGAGSPQHRRA